MEILIGGIILVALMAYASTRIKRTAAEAFTAETVETPEFIIQKPDGFLNVLNGDPQYAFQSYSQDFGTAGANNLRAATAKMQILPGSDIDGAVDRIRSSDDQITNELNEVIGETHYRVLEGTRADTDAMYKVLFKLAEKDNKVFELEVAALETSPETLQRAEALLNSFEIK